MTFPHQCNDILVFCFHVQYRLNCPKKDSLKSSIQPCINSIQMPLFVLSTGREDNIFRHIYCTVLSCSLVEYCALGPLATKESFLHL